MSKNDFTVTAKSRSEQGKGASRRLRRLDSMVPGIVYGGENKPETIMIAHNHLTKLLENEAFYSHILTLEIDGKKQQVVLKDLQRHPYRPIIVHVDFQRITGNEKITMHVPLHFSGEDVAPGVKIDKGIVTHLVTEIEVRCLPKDLPEFIAVDLSNLKLGESVHISDLKLPTGIEATALLHRNDMAVANIQVPRAALAEETTAAPAAEVPVAPKGKEKDEAK
ncbi:MAG: rplY [Gammaproteobacteria bacterium]|jgi:large subunit ribosomal protein L25|nr:rplY [Gammaproteobacteria bacterium]